MTRSSTTVSMYLNGQLIGSAATDGYLPFYGTSTTANMA